MRLIKSILPGLAVLIANSVFAQQLPKDSIEKIRAFINERLKAENIPGVSLSVMRNDSLLWEEGFGFADIENKITATAHTPYAIGSVTKTMTMAALLELLHDKKIGLDEPVNKYLQKAQVPSRNYSSAGISIRQLGSHTSGIPRYTFMCFTDESAACPALPQLINKYAAPVRPAGETYEYSDIGYSVLAQLASELSAQPFSNFMSQSVFTKLKMADSFIDTGFVKNRAASVSYSASRQRMPLYYSPSLGEAAAYSSTHDIALFGMHYLHVVKDKKHLLYEYYNQMQTSQVVRAPGYSYGLAFHIYENYGGYKILLHHGHNGYATSAFFIVPGAGLCIAISTNTSTSFPADLSRKLFELLLPRYDHKALVAESTNWELKPVAFKTDSSYIGQWKGNILIDTLKIPVSVWFQNDGDIQVQVERQYRTLINGVRIEDGYLRGSFRSDIPSEGSKKYPYNLHIKLKKRGQNLLDGSITSSSYNTERTNVLSFPVTLLKENTGN